MREDLLHLDRMEDLRLDTHLIRVDHHINRVLMVAVRMEEDILVVHRHHQTLDTLVDILLLIILTIIPLSLLKVHRIHLDMDIILATLMLGHHIIPDTKAPPLDIQDQEGNHLHHNK